MKTAYDYMESLKSMKTEVYAFGGKVNRFLHVCQSQEEVIKRAQLGQFFTPHHARCMHWCEMRRHRGPQQSLRDDL